MSIKELIAERDTLTARQKELRGELLRVNLARMVNAARLTQAIHRVTPSDPNELLSRQSTHYQQSRAARS